MGYCTDSGGDAVKCNDIKIFSSKSTWATKLSQIGKIKGVVTITTYSLPDISYARRILNKKSKNVYLIAHLKFHKKAMELKEEYPNLRIALNNEIHAKTITIEPITTYFTSANFGKSTWYESSIGLHSKEVHDITQQRFKYLWHASDEINDSFDINKILKKNHEKNKSKWKWR